MIHHINTHVNMEEKLVDAVSVVQIQIQLITHSNNYGGQQFWRTVVHLYSIVYCYSKQQFSPIDGTSTLCW